jgi:two-component system NtrC family sensor kinase
MAFGSVALFDSNFNIAHFLKIIAYLVPFCGLCLNYIEINREKIVAVEQLTATKENLLQQAKQLEFANTELELQVNQRIHAQQELQESNQALQESEKLLKEQTQHLQNTLSQLQKTQSQLVQTEKCPA